MSITHWVRRSHRGSLARLWPVLAAVLLVVPVASAWAGSQSWTGSGPRAKSVYGLARDPQNTQRLWAASFGSGVYRTTDGGTTWTGSRTGLLNTFTRCIAVNAHHPDSLFCGTNDGIYGSIDGGVTWVELLATPVSVRAITWHPVKTAIAYAGTYGNGIYKTTNGGVSWSSVNSGLVNTDVRAIALQPAKPDTMFCGTGTLGGLHQSFNGGLTWKQVADPVANANAIDAVQYDQATQTTIYAAKVDRGVIQSTNGGVTWVTLNAGLPTLQCRALSVVDTLRYVGTDSAGVFVSGVKNTTWRAASGGLTNLSVQALLSVQGAGSTVWAGTDGGGVYRSVSQGGTWTQYDGGLLNTSAFALAVRSATPVHTLYDGAGFGDQFWRSGDQASTWTRATYLFTHDSERAVVVDPLAATTLYMAAYGAGVYRSVDDGATWLYPDSLTLTMSNQSVRALVAYPGQSGHVFAGNGYGVYESTNSGTSWTSRVGNLPPSFTVHSLALVPGSPVTLYAGNDSAGVYKTVDGGVTWVARNSGLQSLFIHALVVDADNPLSLFAATDSGVFASLDGAGTWSKSSTGLPSGATGFDTRTLIQDPAHHNVLYCGLYGAGVFQSLDHGATWQSLFGQNGLSSLFVRSLAIDGFGGVLYAGHDAGVQQLTGYAFAVAVGDPSARPSDDLALSVRRRPGEAVWTIAFRAPATAAARLDVMDASGRRVAGIPLGEMRAGSHLLRWQPRATSGDPLAAGVYWARLRVAGRVRTARVVQLP